MAGNKQKDPVVESKQKLTQLANQYSVYKDRLGERITMNKSEKRNKIVEFFDIYDEDMTSVFALLTSEWARRHEGDRTAFNITNASKEFKLDPDQKAVLVEYIKSRDDPEKVSGFNDKINLSIFSQFAKETMYKKTKYGGELGKTEQDAAVSEEAEKGRKDIVKWLYKHSEIRTLAKEHGKKLGSKNMMPFIEALTKRPRAQQCKIFYLVCVGHEKAASEQDYEDALEKGPDLDSFRNRIQKSKWKFWTRITGNKIDWDMLSTAVVTVDEISQNAGKALLTGDQVNKDDVKELKSQYKRKEGKDKKTSFSNDPDEALIKEIEKRIKKLQKKKNGPNKQELEMLTKDLNVVLQNQGRLIDKAASGTDEGKSFIIDTAAGVMRSASTILENAKIMNGMSGLAMITDVVSICYKMGDLIKNGDELNSKEAAERMLMIGQSALNIGLNVDRMLELNKFVQAGGKIKEAGDALAGSMGTFSNAISTVSGAINVARGAIEVKEAQNMKEKATESKGVLDKVQNKTGDDDLYADDLTQYTQGMYKARALKGGFMIVSGAVGTISGVLNLSGLGAVVGLPMQVLSYTITGIATLAKMIVNNKEGKKSIDRFLGVNAAIDNIKKKYDMYNAKKKKENTFVDTYTHQEVTIPTETLKLDSDMESMIRKELRTYGEAMIGVTSDEGALNYVQTRYAHYLWTRTFEKPQGGYYKETDYDRDEATLELTDDSMIRYATLLLLRGIGVTPRFSKTGRDQPKTTVGEVKRRLKIG